MNKNNLFLILYFILLSFIYLSLPFLEYFFLVPLLFYLKKSKKLNLKLIGGLILLLSIINFIQYYGYGLKFLILILILNIFLYLPFIYSLFYLNKSKFNFILIPLFFIFEFYLFSFTDIGNFWFNYISSIKYYPKIIQFIGSSGTLFLLIMFNVIIYNILNLYFKYKKNKDIEKTRKNSKKKENLNYLILNLTLFLILLIIFVQAFFNSNNYQTENFINSIKIAGIQPNINQDWFERIKNQNENLNLMLNLTNQSIKKYKPRIIIWPEYIFTHSFEFDYDKQEKIQEYSNKNNITLILGSIKLENLSSNKSKRFDTLYIFSPFKKIQIYNSYMPIKIFDKEVIEAKKNPKISINKHSIGFAICFEENFQKYFSKQIIENNPETFIIVGNQYYIKNKFGLKLSSLNSNLRAIENNRYIFRLETGGLSKVIDNYGKTIKEIPIDKKGILLYNIPLISKKTFYSENYNLINNSLFIFSFIPIFYLIFLFLKYDFNKFNKKKKK